MTKATPVRLSRRRAVRLSFVDGEVHLFQGSQPVGDRAIANTPLFEGARIDTGTDGRAEIQFEDGSVGSPVARDLADLVRAPGAFRPVGA